MSYQIYNPEPGTCTCVLRHALAGTVTANVRMISAGGALLDAVPTLKVNQSVQATVKVGDRRLFGLRGLVVNLEEGRPLLQWAYGAEDEAQRIDALLSRHQSRYAATAQPRPAAVASSVASGSTGSASPRGEAAAAASPRPSESQQQSSAQKSTARAAEIAKSADRLDLEATLRSRAKLMRASELASKLHTVQVFDTKTIKELVKDAVQEAITFLGPALQETERRRLLDEAEAAFKERLRLYESEKAGLEEKTKVLQQELVKAQALLEEERKRVFSSYQFTVSDAGMVELEQKLGRILDRSVKTGSAGRALEEELRQIVARLLDDERQKIRDQAQQAQSETIALLEKKVQRLASSLESAEKERDRAQRRAQVLEESGGLPLRNLVEAGLDDDDPSRERKLALLKQIFEFNVEIRRQLAASGLLPKGHPRPQREGDTQATERLGSEAKGASEAEGGIAPERGTQSAAAEATLAASLGIKVKKADRAEEQKPEHKIKADATDADLIVAKEAPEPAPKHESPLDRAEVDPDDMPWEPPEGLGESITQWTAIKNLGR